MSDDSDPDPTLSEWNTRKLNQKPDKITLQIPRKGLAKALSPGAARMKLSKRQTFAFTCDLIRLGEGKVSDFSLSSSGVYYQRKQAEEELGSKLLSKFLDNPNVRYLIVHWDGKIVKYMDGLTEDRIVLGLQAVGSDVPPQFIGSPKVPNGTGAAMKNVMVEYLTKHGVCKCDKFKLVGMCFDTTSSNTGHIKGNDMNSICISPF